MSALEELHPEQFQKQLAGQETPPGGRKLSPLQELHPEHFINGEDALHGDGNSPARALNEPIPDEDFPSRFMLQLGTTGPRQIAREITKAGWEAKEFNGQVVVKSKKTGQLYNFDPEGWQGFGEAARDIGDITGDVMNMGAQTFGAAGGFVLGGGPASPATAGAASIAGAGLLAGASDLIRTQVIGRLAGYEPTGSETAKSAAIEAGLGAASTALPLWFGKPATYRAGAASLGKTTPIKTLTKGGQPIPRVGIFEKLVPGAHLKGPHVGFPKGYPQYASPLHGAAQMPFGRKEIIGAVKSQAMTPTEAGSLIKQLRATGERQFPGAALPFNLKSELGAFGRSFVGSPLRTGARAVGAAMRLPFVAERGIARGLADELIRGGGKGLGNLAQGARVFGPLGAYTAGSVATGHSPFGGLQFQVATALAYVIGNRILRAESKNFTKWVYDKSISVASPTAKKLFKGIYKTIHDYGITAGKLELAGLAHTPDVQNLADEITGMSQEPVQLKNPETGEIRQVRPETAEKWISAGWSSVSG